MLDLKRTRQLAELVHDWEGALRSEYAYVLGMYLGDGHIARVGRSIRLRVSLDAKYPEIVERCRAAVSALMPGHAVSLVSRHGRCIEVQCSSVLWPDLLPQHGPGPKHARPIRLQEWQEAVVTTAPHAFLRGLFDSDGTYFINRVRSRKGVVYEYDRYMFSNMSRDIQQLFRWSCSLLGVETRMSNAKNVSVARRDSVAILNAFLGPKR